MKGELLMKSKLGTTLIVMLIIILLILAGVLLFGKNGVLTKASINNSRQSEETQNEIQENTKKFNVSFNVDDDSEFFYGIFYDANGGVGEIAKQKIEEETIKLNSGSGITRENYLLYNWNTEADGTGTSYELGEEIQTSSLEKTVILYAKWLQVVEGVVIPEGYYYVGGTESSGVVISDSPDDENDYAGQADVGSDLVGNQFVWVPVNSTIGNDDMYVEPETAQALTSVTYTNTDGESVTTSVTTERYSKLYDFTAQSAKTVYSGEDYIPAGSEDREPDILSGIKIGEKSYYAKIKSRKTGEACTSVEQVAEQYVEDYNDMIKSVVKYGGFYVGRYELTGTADNPTQIKGIVLKDKNWYDAYNICQSFTKGTVQSTMIWGCQWDAIMNWIDSTAETTGKYVGYGTSSTSWGNYNSAAFEYDEDLDGVIEDGESKIRNVTKPIPTGSAEYTKANNIYDLAGNYKEWTQEASYNSR